MKWSVFEGFREADGSLTWLCVASFVNLDDAWTFAGKAIDNGRKMAVTRA